LVFLSETKLAGVGMAVVKDQIGEFKGVYSDSRVVLVDWHCYGGDRSRYLYYQTPLIT